MAFMTTEVVFSRTMAMPVVLLLMTVASVWSPSQAAVVAMGPKPSTFKAAVYEHKTITLEDPSKVLSRTEAVKFMEQNLAVYRNQAKKAREEGAQIIVFPENGIYGYDFSRKSIEPLSEPIPEPENISWSPCSNPDKFARSDVQKALSCIAKDNSLYVVANMADKVPCQIKTDPKCPKDGYYQYNTNVAYSPDGTFLTKYHKVHLWFEPYFNPSEPKVSYFETPFAGRIGLVICFDLLFDDPLITLVTEHNVTTIAYPTNFVDFLPVVSAIGFHSSVARGLGINLLSANTHDVTFKGYGSGIYTPNGPSAYYYDDRETSSGKLLVSSIDSLSQQIMPSHEQKGDGIPMMNGTKPDEFEVLIFGDVWTFQLLEESSGNVNVCNNKICCSLNYSISGDSNQNSDKKDLFALGAFDGLHDQFGRFYWQVCSLVRCADSNDKTSCGKPAKISSTKFESISMKGHFQTKYIYPQVVLSSGNDDKQLRLPEENTWSFSDSTLAWESGKLEEPVVSATMVGRIFSRDNDVDGGVSGRRKDLTSTVPTTTHPGNAGVKVMERCAVLIAILMAMTAVVFMNFHYL